MRVIELVRGILVRDDNETTAVSVRLVSEQETPFRGPKRLLNP